MRRRQTPQRRSQRTGGRPTKFFGRTSPKSYGRTSCPKGTHPMSDGSCMRGAYHGASPQQYMGGGGLYPYNPGGGDIPMYDYNGIECDGADGGSYSQECDGAWHCGKLKWECTDLGGKPTVIK